jgi:ribose 5-phosphate isomerase B
MDLKKEIIAIGADHAGYLMKEFLKCNLRSQEYNFHDYGPFSEEAVDYPDMIHPLARDIENGKINRGVIICGSGNGVAMVANKYKKVRAAICWNREITELSRRHNDANLIALPARFISFEEALEFVKIFFSTAFEGGRHQRRVEKIAGKL